MSGIPFPTAITWYENVTKAAKIVEKHISFPLIAPTSVTWRVYATGGTSVAQTLVDSIVYTGIFEVSRTRALDP